MYTVHILIRLSLPLEDKFLPLEDKFTAENA
jgi:hypothetical protein